MKIFSTQDIKSIERLTMEAQSLSSLDLMERAASAISCELISRWTPTRKFIVFAGSGNNGGDALAVARMLVEQGYRVEVFLFNIGGTHLTHECEVNRDLLIAAGGVDFTEVGHGQFTPPFIAEDDIVIDGLFGSGLREKLTGGFQSMVRYINENAHTVVSIDVPSGLFGEWNAENERNNIVRATLTLAIQFPRLAFYFDENADFIGEVKVLDIDLDESAIRSTKTQTYLVEPENIKSVMKPRKPQCNKFDFGRLMLVAGSYGFLGAAVLSAKAALRAGCGTVTVHAPQCGMAVLQTAVPEAMYVADKHNIVPSEILPQHRYSAYALGPGIGTHKLTVDALERFLINAKEPCVLDADALNCIKERPALLNNLPVKSIITPHAGEFDRLFGNFYSDETRLKKAVEVARLYNIIIVLKGRYTMVVRPDSQISINIAGNPGMATAGSGDVLTGIIGSLMAQGYTPEVSAVAGVYFHAVAGDMALRKTGTYGMLATDIIAMIPAAIRSVVE